MKIKVGDKVKFLNDTGSGEITRIIDKKTALVQIDGGFEVPWLIKDLVVSSGSYYGDHEEEEVEVKDSPVFSEQITTDSDIDRIDDEEIVLAFVPDRSTAEFNTYLINSSSYQFKYTISRQQEGEMVMFHESTLEAGLKISLGSYRPGNIGGEELFRIQGIFFNAGFYNYLSPLNKLVKISGTELFDPGRQERNDYFHSKAILYRLFDWRKSGASEEAKSQVDTEALKDAMMTKKDKKMPDKKKATSLKEVNLHIEHLMDNHKLLSPGEIMDIQITRFRSEIDGAIHQGIPRIVFIHGVGNGKLKIEIRKILDTEYRSSVKYQDASFKEYGYGATMVILK